MNIVLIGIRGSGKSKLGQLIADKLKREFIDIDNIIEKDNGKTISEIVDKHGWEHFRKLENIATEKISKIKNTVIATGGGTVLNEENMTALKKNGSIIYLKVSPEVCAKRIKDSTERPALTNEKTLEDEIKKIFSERNKLYKKNADYIFERSSDLEKDADAIISITN